ncbi:RsfA family transcriptional regulator [Niallia sp. FSL R7-0271]|uniref:RsfA family transcriptional regulator n=1 Tax=Niallia sp. FSL R7-0271 TaxID=2921678 RepID=UPI0030F93527
MSPTRQDAWSQEEDILLAEVVLRCIRDGSTQLQAFEEVGKQLSRTSAACGFRWNSYVRKQYKEEIEVAKAQRKQLKKGIILVEDANIEPVDEQNNGKQEIDNEFKKILLYLEEVYNKSKKYEQLKTRNNHETELKGKINELININNVLQMELDSKEEAYKGLVDLMEQARKMVELK